jgi:hypothetical protein
MPRTRGATRLMSSDEKLKRIAAILETTEEKDGCKVTTPAFYDLYGAIVDLEYMQKADPVTIEMLKRVADQVRRVQNIAHGRPE